VNSQNTSIAPNAKDNS
jgi:hypothetical protein